MIDDFSNLRRISSLFLPVDSQIPVRDISDNRIPFHPQTFSKMKEEAWRNIHYRQLRLKICKPPVFRTPGGRC